eukprot:6346379-Pyramimonas_sp.AAC.1
MTTFSPPKARCDSPALFLHVPPTSDSGTYHSFQGAQQLGGHHAQLCMVVTENVSYCLRAESCSLPPETLQAWRRIGFAKRVARLCH